MFLFLQVIFFRIIFKGNKKNPHTGVTLKVRFHRYAVMLFNNYLYMYIYSSVSTQNWACGAICMS